MAIHGSLTRKVRAHMQMASFANGFQEFYEQWRANPRWWFKATPEDDAFLALTYGHLLDEQSDENTIARIIVHDQLSAHVARALVQAQTQETRALVAKHRAIALELALKHAKHLNSLDDIDFTFALLPIRHQGTHRDCLWVAQQAWLRIAQSPENRSQRLRAFIKATYTRAVLENSPNNDIVPLSTLLSIDINSVDYGGFVCNANASWNDDALIRFQDVLEYAPIAERWRDARIHKHHPVVKALLSHPWPELTNKIIISLSGGVDSMVIATVLRRLFPEREIIGVHVNYCNRADSHEEEAFARTWAAVLGIKYCVRHIREFHRQKAKDIDIRGTYETYTRDVRFASYTFAWQAKHQAPHVILGHHEDDTFENILTNIAHAEKYECLYGMLPVAESESKLGQIVFHRPLLRVSKDAIYQLARAWGIPYLQNSTLAETQRGLIRDVVRPTLESWNPLFPRRMLEFADVVSEFAAAFEKQVESAVLETRALNDTTYVWTVASENARQHSSLTSTRFWRRYFHALLHTTASWRSLDALCELIARKDKVRVMLTNHICIRIACTNLKTSVTVTKG